MKNILNLILMKEFKNLRANKNSYLESFFLSLEYIELLNETPNISS